MTGVPAPRRLAALGVLAALTAAACTSGGAEDDGQSAGRPSAVVQLPAGPATVAEGRTPGELSVAVSRALFTRAPVVVVARADDGPALAEAGAQAERVGAPLLVQDGGGAPTGAAAGAAAADPALVAEVTRLGAERVLLVGAPLTGLPGAVTTAADVPAASRPAPAALTVLVDSAGEAATRTAATASARAAGAVVVPVAGSDPRADPAAIAALAGAPRQVLAVGSGFGPGDRLDRRVALAVGGRQLPGGGQVLFPGRRLVALYGTPGTPSLGVLGEQGAADSIRRAQQVAEPYRRLSDVPVVPTFEIIATVASSSAGPDGNYSTELSVDSLRPLVEQAGAAGMYVVLDLQPGRTDFLTQAKQYAPLLELPHVGLALDAEWRLTADQRPLQQIGSVGIAEVNSVVRWLADLTAAAALPQKLLVLHQFKLSMLRDLRQLDTGRDEVASLVHMDGQGAPALKDGTWGAVTAAAPPGVTFGWKNFYDEDVPMLSPAQTMQRRPTPLMISYQ
ncbi:MAG TPA: hypothetical protein VFR07_09480 [Mycobacteriales bacterium]|nr:hypothetical protein [Mycobacteriales bacterium]